MPWWPARCATCSEHRRRRDTRAGSGRGGADAIHIPDTQSERDERHLAIQQVGVKRVRFPLTLKLGAHPQGSVGDKVGHGVYKLPAK